MDACRKGVPAENTEKALIKGDSAAARLDAYLNTADSYLRGQVRHAWAAPTALGWFLKDSGYLCMAKT